MKTLRQITNSNDIMETNTVVVNKQAQGNFFVMDSEQVVSNPYQELQAEALDGTKKNSLTERLTSVRNNVAEYQLRTKTNYLDKQHKHSLRNMHMDSSSLRYQTKVMDINKRRNDLMMQQRITPEKDFSYDSRQINNCAKRLGVTNEKSFYLDKELQYPLRATIGKDHNKKPFIKKARKTMQARCTQKKIQKHDMERINTATTFDRATTAQSMTTSIDIPSPEPSTRGPITSNTRAGSKSAPIRKSSGDAQYSAKRGSIFDDADGKLPSINNTRNKSHVKFEEPTPFKQSTPSGLQRSHTFNGGEKPRRTYHREAWDSDSDDDYAYCEKVDLRALFFGDKSQSGDSKSAISGTTTPRTVSTRASTDAALLYRSKSAQPVKEEQLLKENQEIRLKIDKFLDSLSAEENPLKKGEQTEEKREEKEEKRDKEVEKQIEKQQTKSKLSVAAKAAYLLSVFSKPIDRKMQWGCPTNRRRESQDIQNLNTQPAANVKTKEDDKPKKKEMWEFIKTNIENGNVRAKYSANDLLLQQLTGILVQSDKKPCIPTHSASRALRHTPTFKMQRIVEELMRQRTRYEQQEVEKLQQQDEVSNEGPGVVEEEEEVEEVVVQQPYQAPRTYIHG